MWLFTFRVKIIRIKVRNLAPRWREPLFSSQYPHVGRACMLDDGGTCFSTITEDSVVAPPSFHRHLHTPNSIAWALSPPATLCSVSSPGLSLDTGPLHILFSAWNVLSPLHLVKAQSSVKPYRGLTSSGEPSLMFLTRDQVALGASQSTCSFSVSHSGSVTCSCDHSAGNSGAPVGDSLITITQRLAQSRCPVSPF